jgi:hypothetical protein
MSATYWSGAGSKVKFTPTGLSEITGISNDAWGDDAEARTAEVSNGQTGNNVARIGGLEDSSGSFDVVWDSELEPDAAGIKINGTGVLKMYYGNSTKYRSRAIIIKKVGRKATVRQGEIRYVVNWEQASGGPTEA